MYTNNKAGLVFSCAQVIVIPKGKYVYFILVQLNSSLIKKKKKKNKKHGTEIVKSSIYARIEFVYFNIAR